MALGLCMCETGLEDIQYSRDNPSVVTIDGASHTVHEDVFELIATLFEERDALVEQLGKYQDEIAKAAVEQNRALRNVH